jgi:hypothetical protein
MANARERETGGADDEAEDDGGIFRRVVAAALGVQAEGGQEQEQRKGKKS